jgi:hypothetical protein
MHGHKRKRPSYSTNRIPGPFSGWTFEEFRTPRPTLPRTGRAFQEPRRQSHPSQPHGTSRQNQDHA